MPSIITDAFQEWNVNKILANEPAVPDQMIFAFIPGLDATAEIDPGEGMPDEAQIVYSSAFTHMAKLNENAVVYSVVLDTTIGNWSYNWIGIADSATGAVLMIVHCDEQKKIKTAGGVQGNSLIRNMVMEFTGAAEATQITITPETWQIDYSERHAGSDERVRAENIDVYGIAAFDGDGFLVTSAGGMFQVAPGLGYVHGLRCYAEAAASPGALATSTKVWVDATWQGTATGAWSVTYSLRIAPELENYEKDGFQHYVFAIAETDAAGNITDLRPPFPLQALEQVVDELDVYSREESDKRFLQGSKNLSDVDDRQKARENLGIYSAEEVDKRCPHRVGDAFLTTSAVNPAESWPGTQWADMSGNYNARTIMIGANPLTTGGANDVTLSVENIPSHGHSLTGLRTRSAGGHSHLYDKYQKNGTQDSTRVSVDNTRLGIEQAYTGSAGEHSHEIEGEIGSTGGGKPFSIVSSYVMLRGWLRTA
ncbi:phage tail protein [Enterobacter roggenkampii]|uniref:phage tail-collar fiber domain-containing protein n=1 Tax=Enterobacter roggenkampii TaxID=1812935 RepID=UPI0018C1D200|nr:phage tail protein [Enterobacter roggenkampii]MBF9817771.1 phage tail protein [Enterobacter roggenkampii]